MRTLILCKIFVCLNYIYVSSQNVIELSGPGLNPQKNIMPARYFYINFTNIDEQSYSSDLFKDIAVEIDGKSKRKNHCRTWHNKLDRKDGVIIVRYKLYETCYDLSIGVYYKSKLIEGSPFVFNGSTHPEQCNCPEKNIEKWLEHNSCPKVYEQIDKDLKPFNGLNMKNIVPGIIKKHHRPESVSFCHYVIKHNSIYRDCYGKHVGFNMFSDNILLFITRRVVLPDMELIINLGDWPLIRKNGDLYPVFSWCGSDDTIDIVMPTYDITESTLENMGRVTLDMLSVQGGAELRWPLREARAFWRGRDSRAERLTLIDIARQHPHLFNASITNFFFFRDREEKYGPKQPHISFFKFFDYKYQINVDGTVAAYRFPYLLAGGSLVLKQDSPYYEHFYKELREWEHYVPVKRDLSDLVERVQWAREHDSDARRIATNGKKFAFENLMPHHIICYHVSLFNEYSKRIDGDVNVYEGMKPIVQPEFECDCDNEMKTHEEL